MPLYLIVKGKLLLLFYGSNISGLVVFLSTMLNVLDSLGTMTWSYKATGTGPLGIVPISVKRIQRTISKHLSLPTSEIRLAMDLSHSTGFYKI